MGDRLQAGMPPRYVTSHIGQLSLISAAGREMSTDQGPVTLLCGWEGNRGSGVAPAMRHRHCGLSTYGLNGLRKADETPVYAPVRGIVPFTIL